MKIMNGITKKRIVPFWILSAILAVSIIAGCAIRPNFPSVPFAAHKAGSTIVKDVKLDHDIRYAFYLMLYHENTKEDAERVRKLAGSGMYRADEYKLGSTTVRLFRQINLIGYMT